MANKIGEHFVEWGKGVLGRWYGMVVIIIALLASTIPLIIGLINAEVAWWWIALFPILLLLFIVLCFWQFHKVADERDSYKHKMLNGTGVEFYPCRPSMEVATKYIKRHEVIYAVFATGQGLRDAKIYKDLKRFKYLILLNPDKPHLEEYGTGFHSKIEEDLREEYRDISENIRKTTNKASPHMQEVKWLDGCLPFSMMLGDPESGNGEVLIEVYIPHREAYDRPMLIFSQNNYPELFQVLKESYQNMLVESDSAK